MSTKLTTLRDKLAHSERLLEETGSYHGLGGQLPLHDSDPLKFEGFHSRLLSTIISTRETMKFIASSPAVRDVEEFVIGLYTPEGDVIALGVAAV